MESFGDDALIYNPSYVLDKEQARLAAIMSKMAFENGQNIAKKMPIEFLVRLSGEKQIKKAISFGIRDLGSLVGLVYLGNADTDWIEEVDFEPDRKAISRKYGVEDGKKLMDMVYEKMAMVDV